MILRDGFSQSNKPEAFVLHFGETLLSQRDECSHCWLSKRYVAEV